MATRTSPARPSTDLRIDPDQSGIAERTAKAPRRRACAALPAVLAVLQAAISPANAAELEIFPGDSFEAAVESLNPGDTLTVHEGTYADAGRISIGVKGTAAEPVVIQADPGEARPLVTRSPGDAAQNTINIEGAEYLTIRGLEISSNGGDGITMSGGPSYITLEDLAIHDIAVGINFRSSMHHITARRNHIYDTSDTGEGMYVGCNYATCAVSESLIEHNWIHDTLAATQGDGIEIKRGSHSNIIRDNVIHDTNWPCLLLYGTEGNPRNLVEGNVMWNCGEAGIQVAADTVIRNNLILDSPHAGLISQSHQGVSPNALEIVHNTFVTGGTCLRLNGWNDKEGMVFANNAVYCSSDSFAIGGLGGVVVSGNVFEPAPPGFPSAGYVTGRSEQLDFVDAASLDVYPTSDSTLLGAGDPAYAATVDFNGTERLGGVDAGAYAWTGAVNPGWEVAPGFKDSSPGPTLSFEASPTNVDYQGESTLTWQTANATSCEASGAWSGTRPTNGEQATGALMSTSDYTLTCESASGDTVSDTVTVTVGEAPVDPPTLELAADITTVEMNGSTTITWNATNAEICVASGAWSGSKPVSGSESTGALTADVTYALECSGPGGSASESLTITVTASGGDDDAGDGADDSGSGASSWPLLIVLLAAAGCAGRRRSRRHAR